jgi:lysophospholipase L1-like esterase
MDKLIAQAPDALLVFSNIIPFPQEAQATMTFNSKVKGLVDERAAEGAHILFVDQFADFPTGELGDGVHPNKAGYARMGAKWYDVIKPYLP